MFTAICVILFIYSLYKLHSGCFIVVLVFLLSNILMKHLGLSETAIMFIWGLFVGLVILISIIKPRNDEEEKSLSADQYNDLLDKEKEK